MRVSAIVVSFNTRELLRRCLESLTDCYEVIVVDNGSKDGSDEMVMSEFPLVKLVKNAKNLGFGAANNLGFDAMGGDIALLLNSDAFAVPGAIELLRNEMSRPETVACGGRLVDPMTMSVTQNSCSANLTLWAVFSEQTGLEKLAPRSIVLSPYWTTKRLLEHHKTGETHVVEQVMGACLMMRPVERFDERFFLYCEDTELCLRLRSHGSILYVPDAVFGHELGASSAANRWESVARYNYGKELYFSIHHGRTAAGVCYLFNRSGAFLRLLLWSLATMLSLGTRSDLRAKADLFWKVLTAPKSGPPRPC